MEGGDSLIKVCDALMGLGKSSAAITYINEHPEKKFIYITPYLSEAERIKNSCPEAHFVEPSNRLPAFGFSKVKHTEHLIFEGRNIATTHVCFTNYTMEMLEFIQRNGYTLLLDEVLSVFEDFKYKQRDVDDLLALGILEQDGDIYRLTDAGYHYDGSLCSSIIETAMCRDLIKVSDTADKLFYWSIPASYLTSFDEVIVMTYMFHGQAMQMYLDMSSIPYSYIGVKKCDDGLFRFTEEPQPLPERMQKLRGLINIFDREKLHRNFHGCDRMNTGSMNWFQSHPEEAEVLRKNLYNYFRGRGEDVSADELMWGTYNKDMEKLASKGFKKGFVPFNARATNQFRNKRMLAYLANPYMNVGTKLFFKNHGVEVDEDSYALSTFLQWIWRSAIRDGKEIEIYVPIARMRKLLNEWLDSLEGEGNDSGKT
jgi:hypothetical protein